MKSDISNTPLVSVIVITYNSSSTIVETLDSIKSQTYRNLELIVSDDHSQDKTCEVVNEWININKDCFVNAELVTTERNTGVSGNINRGVFHSHGEWIKSIAGDDMLVPTAIADFVDFVVSSKNSVKMCVSDVQPFSNDNSIPQTALKAYQQWFNYSQEDYECQLRRVNMFLVFVGPTYFYSRELFDEIGGFDEKYGNLEEWPFVYKIIKMGNRIYALDKKLVKYRVSPTSLCNGKQSGLGNYGLFNSKYHFFFDSPFRDLIHNRRYFIAWDMLLDYNVKMLRFKSNNSFWVRLLGLFAMAISPYAYLRLFGLTDFRYYN